MKAHFTFTPDPEPHGAMRKLMPLLNKPGFTDYINQFAGQELILEIKPASKSVEKQQMYAYYRGPLMDVAVMAFTDAGYEGVDKVKAHYLLQANCAKDFIVDPHGIEEYFVISMADMTKKRLHKYISDCIHLLQAELNVQEIPDAEMYRYNEETGHQFKNVKFE